MIRIGLLVKNCKIHRRNVLKKSVQLRREIVDGRGSDDFGVRDRMMVV